MLRLVSIMCVLLGLLLAAPARAQESCAAVDRVWDSVSLIRQMQRRDDPAIRTRLNRMAESFSTNPQPSIRDYGTALKADLAEGADAQAILGLSLTPGLATELGRISHQYDCSPDGSDAFASTSSHSDRIYAGTVPTGGEQTDTGSETPASTTVMPERGRGKAEGVEIEADPTLFLLMTGGAGLVAGGIILWRRAKANVKREERYMLMEVVHVRVEDREFFATMMDISMNGFKLRHEGEIDGNPKLSVELNGDWNAGLVRWSNEKFAGVKFQRPLDAETFSEVLDPSPDRIAA